jgi:hypothetical protein
LRTVACSLMSPDAVSLIRTDKESIASPSRAWIVSSGSTVGWCSTAERTKTGDQSRPLRWPQMPGYPCQPAPCSGNRLVRAGRSRVLVAIGGTVIRAFASSSYWPRSRGPRPSAGPREARPTAVKDQTAASGSKMHDVAAIAVRRASIVHVTPPQAARIPLGEVPFGGWLAGPGRDIHRLAPSRSADLPPIVHGQGVNDDGVTRSQSGRTFSACGPF